MAETPGDEIIFDDDLDENDYVLDNEKEDALLADTDLDFEFEPEITPSENTGSASKDFKRIEPLNNILELGIEERDVDETVEVVILKTGGKYECTMVSSSDDRLSVKAVPKPDVMVVSSHLNVNKSDEKWVPSSTRLLSSVFEAEDNLFAPGTEDEKGIPSSTKNIIQKENRSRTVSTKASDDEEEDEDKRVRFKTEKSNILSLKKSIGRSGRTWDDIPDSLDDVIFPQSKLMISKLNRYKKPKHKNVESSYHETEQKDTSEPQPLSVIIHNRTEQQIVTTKRQLISVVSTANTPHSNSSIDYAEAPAQEQSWHSYADINTNVENAQPYTDRAAFDNSLESYQPPAPYHSDVSTQHNMGQAQLPYQEPIPSWNTQQQHQQPPPMQHQLPHQNVQESSITQHFPIPPHGQQFPPPQQVSSHFQHHMQPHFNSPNIRHNAPPPHHIGNPQHIPRQHLQRMPLYPPQQQPTIQPVQLQPPQQPHMQLHPLPEQQMQLHPPGEQQMQLHPPGEQQIQLHPSAEHQMQLHPPPEYQMQLYPQPEQQVQLHPSQQQQVPLHHSPQQQMPVHMPSQQQVQLLPPQQPQVQLQPPIQQQVRLHPPLQHQIPLHPPAHQASFHHPPQQIQFHQHQQFHQRPPLTGGPPQIPIHLSYNYPHPGIAQNNPIQHTFSGPPPNNQAMRPLFHNQAVVFPQSQPGTFNAHQPTMDYNAAQPIHQPPYSTPNMVTPQHPPPFQTQFQQGPVRQIIPIERHSNRSRGTGQHNQSSQSVKKYSSTSANYQHPYTVPIQQNITKEIVAYSAEQPNISQNHMNSEISSSVPEASANISVMQVTANLNNQDGSSGSSRHVVLPNNQYNKVENSRINKEDNCRIAVNTTENRKRVFPNNTVCSPVNNKQIKKLATNSVVLSSNKNPTVVLTSTNTKVPTISVLNKSDAQLDSKSQPRRLVVSNSASIPINAAQNGVVIKRNTAVEIDSIRSVAANLTAMKPKLTLGQRFSALKSNVLEDDVESKNDEKINDKPIGRLVIVASSANRVVNTFSKVCKVIVKNIAASTKSSQIKKAASSCGTVKKISWNSLTPSQNEAEITFGSQDEAKLFCSRYNRKMIDLSLITVSIMPD